MMGWSEFRVRKQRGQSPRTVLTVYRGCVVVRAAWVGVLLAGAGPLQLLSTRASPASASSTQLRTGTWQVLRSCWASHAHSHVVPACLLPSSLFAEPICEGHRARLAWRQPNWKGPWSVQRQGWPGAPGSGSLSGSQEHPWGPSIMPDSPVCVSLAERGSCTSLQLPLISGRQLQLRKGQGSGVSCSAPPRDHHEPTPLGLAPPSSQSRYSYLPM